MRGHFLGRRVFLRQRPLGRRPALDRNRNRTGRNTIERRFSQKSRVTTARGCRRRAIAKPEMGSRVSIAGNVDNTFLRQVLGAEQSCPTLNCDSV